MLSLDSHVLKANVIPTFHSLTDKGGLIPDAPEVLEAIASWLTARSIHFTFMSGKVMEGLNLMDLGHHLQQSDDQGMAPLHYACQKVSYSVHARTVYLNI